MTNQLSLSNSGEPLLKAQDVAELLNISKAFAYLLIQRGELRSVAIGAARRVRPQDLERFIEGNLTPVEE